MAMKEILPENNNVSVIELPESEIGDVSVIDRATDETPPSPTNVKGVSPQQVAAANAITGPPIRKIQTSELNVKQNFNKFLGRVPSSAELAEFQRLAPGEVEKRLTNARADAIKKQRLADIKKAGTPFGVSPEIADELKFEPGRKPEDLAANALNDKIVEEPGAEETTTEGETTSEKFATPEFDQILESFGISKIETSDFSSIKQTERERLDSVLEGIDIEFDGKIDAQREKNANLTSALQARLIKAGVDLEGISFQSAVDSQENRNQTAIDKIERERIRQRSVARANSSTALRDIGLQERTEAFNAQVANINNLFEGIGLATNIMSVFDKRSQFERQQEQEASEHLDRMMLEFNKLDQADRELNVGILVDFIERGMISAFDEESISRLNRMEKLAGFEEGFLVDAAVKGNQQRLLDMASKEAETAKTEAETKLTGERIKLTQAEIIRTKQLAANAAKDKALTFGEFVKLKQEIGQQTLDVGEEGKRNEQQQANFDKLQSEFVRTVKEHITLNTSLLDKPISPDLARMLGVPVGTLHREIQGEIIPDTGDDGFDNF